MNEAMLHDLSRKMGGRFKLTTLVQKRLVQLMQERSEIVTKNSGGRPIRLVTEEIAKGHLQLVAPDGTALTGPIEK